MGLQDGKQVTRVRYTTNNVTGVMESTQSFLIGDGRTVKVVLFLATLTYQILDLETGNVIKQGLANNPRLLKVIAKETLVELGTNFKKEEPHKKTVVEVLMQGE